MHGWDSYDFHARTYYPAGGFFMTPDPKCEQYYWISPYAYCANNPIKYVDPTGMWVESLWDAANIGMGVTSLVDNIQSGNVGGAIVDGVGVIIDVAAIIVPLVPGGVGSVIKGVRAGDKALDAVKTGDKVLDATKTGDKVTDATKNRVKLRKSTKEAVKESAEKSPTGNFIDPNTGKEIEKGQEVFGHKKGSEWKKYKKDPDNKTKTRKEVIEDQNNSEIYQIEDKMNNASHKYEEK